MFGKCWGKHDGVTDWVDRGTVKCLQRQRVAAAVAVAVAAGSSRKGVGWKNLIWVSAEMASSAGRTDS